MCIHVYVLVHVVVCFFESAHDNMSVCACFVGVPGLCVCA